MRACIILGPFNIALRISPNASNKRRCPTLTYSPPPTTVSQHTPPLRVACPHRDVAHPPIHPSREQGHPSAPTLPRTAPRTGRHPPGHVRIGVSFSLIYNLPARNQVSPHPRLLPPPEIAVPAVSTLARPPTRPPCPFRAFRCVARRAGACAQCTDERRAPAWRVYRKAVCTVAVPLRLAGTPLAI